MTPLLTGTVATGTRADGARADRLRARLLRATGALSALTTPFLPDDYLELVDPLLCVEDLRARVVEIHREAGGARTLVLRPGAGWTGHRAGQYLRLGVEVEGVLHWRSYSLTAPPRADGLVTVTVVPVAGGRVSQALTAGLKVGDLLRLAPADGALTLPAQTAEQLLLVSAGSGLTPVMGLLRELDARGPLPDTVLVHSVRQLDDLLFAAELRALERRHPRLRLVLRETATEGRLDPRRLADLVPDWAHRSAWACGPAGLLDALEAHWVEHGLRPLATERFTLPVVAAPDAQGGTATFARTGTEVEVPGASPLLTGGESAGVLLPSGCRMGICFGCVVPLLSGQVRDLRTGDVHGEPGDLVQTCISAPAGDVTLDA